MPSSLFAQDTVWITTGQLDAGFDRKVVRKKRDILFLFLWRFSGRLGPLVGIMSAVVAHAAFRKFCQNTLRVMFLMAFLAVRFILVL